MTDQEIHRHNRGVYQTFLDEIVEAVSNATVGKRMFVETMRCLLGMFRRENEIGVWSVIEGEDAVDIRVQGYESLLVHKRVVVFGWAANWQREGF